jgi:superfamily II DNA or RNA helicase
VPKLAPRGWQIEALDLWERAGYKGIISVVTGGGKTVFALSCIEKFRPTTTLIVVPTSALLDQWWEEAASYFDLSLDEINIITGTKKLKQGTINLAVLNTAAKLPERTKDVSCFLIVDECHKAAAEHFKSVLQLPTVATLGLSATPERPYDEGLRDILVPCLGEVIFKYGYAEALKDKVIVPFILKNVVFSLEDDRQKEYDKVSSSIARSIQEQGYESELTIALFLKRARILNLSPNRVRLALKLIAINKSKKVLVFHENVEACELIHHVLTEHGVSSGVYHSKLPLRTRATVLNKFRGGEIRVLVTCRALDEGFNVPETEIGIIAASTATNRQRIQRLGRVVRPAKGKEAAIIYTLVATPPEIARLKKEEENLEGIAEVSWSRA